MVAALEEFEAACIQRIHSGQCPKLLDPQMEARLVRIEDKVDQTLEHARQTNGRVGKLEEWQLAQRLAAERTAGRQEAAAATFLTRKQLAALAAALTFLVGIAATAIPALLEVL